MQVRTLAAATVLAVTSFTVVGLSSPALALCESYSGGCPTPPAGGGGVIGGNEQLPGSDDDGTSSTGGTGAPVQGTGSRAGVGTTRADAPATLPFTGGELVLLTAIGAGALAGGTALVVAGRRRSGTA